jgi:hypothetical protein
MAEAAQFALDANHAPGPVLPRQAHDQATSSSPIGGRPGGFGCRYRAAISLRCQRNNVPGVPIRWARSAFGSIRASAARAARSGQDRRGPGLFRRSTATSCRNASIFASFDAEDRANSASQDST